MSFRQRRSRTRIFQNRPTIETTGVTGGTAMQPPDGMRGRNPLSVFRTPTMKRLLLAALGAAALATSPGLAQTSADNAIRRLTRQLVDGNINVQVYTAAHTAQLCYRAAAANSPVGSRARDRNGLTESQRRQFAECAEQSGYRLLTGGR